MHHPFAKVLTDEILLSAEKQVAMAVPEELSTFAAWELCSGGGEASQLRAAATDIFRVLTRAVRGRCCSCACCTSALSRPFTSSTPVAKHQAERLIY